LLKQEHALADTAITGRPARKWVGTSAVTGTSGALVRGVLMGICLALVLVTGGFFYFLWQVGGAASNQPLAAADGIVVLTGGRARVETAIDLLEGGMARRLLISGVHRDSSSASIRRAIKGKRETFDCCVDIDKAALDTVGNAVQAAGWARQNHFDSLIIVTSDYHMPRSMIEMARKLPGTRIIPHNVRSDPASITDPALLRLLVPEYLKYVAARLGLGVRGGEGRTALASIMAY
jgi:uncharacterized SAM-binding protein YcdF (DUF218 family)